MPGFYENAGDPGNQFGTSAKASATEAKHWANYTPNVVVPEDGTEYSAKHYSEASSSSATNAAASETAAASSAVSAATSETNAAVSETNAAASEVAAADSETNAAASETAAASSASAASTSETNAAASELAAGTSETNAATSESNAATSETNAAASALAASTSETNAATSETNAAASAVDAAASAASATSSDYATSSWFTTTNNATNWDIAYGWGDHSIVGYLTSETSHADVLVDADVGVTVQGYDAATAKTDGANTWTLQQSFKEVSETQYSLTGTVIDPANGTLQYKTLGSNTTFTESLVDGQAVTLMIDDGTAYTITWPTITWVGGSAPTLPTSGYAVIELWQINSVLYGAHVGDA